MRGLGLGVLVLCVAFACAPGAPAGPSSAKPASAPAASATAVGRGAGGASAPAASAPAASPANAYLPAAGEAATNIRVATCAVTGGFIHLYTALEAGIFEKYGLSAEHVRIGGSGPALAALSTNEIQFLYCAADATVPGLASGMDVRLIAAPLVGLPWYMIARPEVRSVADLKGRAVGVPRAGDLADRLSRLTLERHGLVPNQDVDLRPTGGSQPERYQLMLANVVQGNVLTPPLDAQARKDGLNIIYDLNDLGIPAVYSAAHTSSMLVREQPRMVQRFVAAIAEAVHYTEKQPAAARQVLRKVLDLDDSEALDSAYQAYAVKHVNRRLALPLDAVQAGIEDARSTGTPVSVRGAEEITVNTFAEELERSGFLAQLWGGELPPR